MLLLFSKSQSQGTDTDTNNTTNSRILNGLGLCHTDGQTLTGASAKFKGADVSADAKCETDVHVCRGGCGWTAFGTIRGRQAFGWTGPRRVRVANGGPAHAPPPPTATPQTSHVSKIKTREFPILCSNFN